MLQYIIAALERQRSSSQFAHHLTHTPEIPFPMISKRIAFFDLSLFIAVLTFASSAAISQEWGNLKGRFVVKGAAPAPVKIIPDKDLAACELPMYSRQLIISKDGGLKNVCIFMKKPSKPVPVHPSYAKALASEILLDNTKCRFQPHIVVMTTAQKLRVKNSDNVGHNANVTSFNDENSHNPNIPAGKFVDLDMPSVETRPINVACNSHAWMKAYVLVRNEPYMAVSSATGEFEIKNLPAGEHTFQFWQENAGYLRKASSGGEIISKGRAGYVKLNIQGGKTTDLGEITIQLDDVLPKN
ncbi:MAG: hypothetical protein P8M80_01825 [Pirellulaceae bacterium]|nr:hypothetical protein [Pirellulaceae bacterium]